MAYMPLTMIRESFWRNIHMYFSAPVFSRDICWILLRMKIKEIYIFSNMYECSFRKGFTPLHCALLYFLLRCRLRVIVDINYVEYVLGLGLYFGMIYINCWVRYQMARDNFDWFAQHEVPSLGPFIILHDEVNFQCKK